MQHVSALSLERAMKDSNMETYAVMFKDVEDDGVGTPVPTEISDVMTEYADLMPDELPKKLPPRRAVTIALSLS